MNLATKTEQKETMWTDEQLKWSEDYFKNDARKLRSVVDMVLRRFAWITDKDDYYSFASEVFVKDILPKYDAKKGAFHLFVQNTLYRRIMSEITATNRQKRRPYLQDKNGFVLDTDGKLIPLDVCSIEAEIDTSDGTHMLLQETIASDFDLYSEVFGNYTDKTALFMQRLSKRQAAIVKLLDNGYERKQIQTMLHITGNQMTDEMKEITSYKNISILA